MEKIETVANKFKEMTNGAKIGIAAANHFKFKWFVKKLSHQLQEDATDKCVFITGTKNLDGRSNRHFGLVVLYNDWWEQRHIRDITDVLDSKKIEHIEIFSV